MGTIGRCAGIGKKMGAKKSDLQEATERTEGELILNFQPRNTRNTRMGPEFLTAKHAKYTKGGTQQTGIFLPRNTRNTRMGEGFSTEANKGNEGNGGDRW
jgi:hypothetical protein